MQTIGVLEKTDYDIFYKILEGEYITPVYQPIVSLTGGQNE